MSYNIRQNKPQATDAVNYIKKILWWVLSFMQVVPSHRLHRTFAKPFPALQSKGVNPNNSIWSHFLKLTSATSPHYWLTCCSQSTHITHIFTMPASAFCLASTSTLTFAAAITTTTTTTTAAATTPILPDHLFLEAPQLSLHLHPQAQFTPPFPIYPKLTFHHLHPAQLLTLTPA